MSIHWTVQFITKNNYHLTHVNIQPCIFTIHVIKLTMKKELRSLNPHPHKIDRTHHIQISIGRGPPCHAHIANGSHHTHIHGWVPPCLSLHRMILPLHVSAKWSTPYRWWVPQHISMRGNQHSASPYTSQVPTCTYLHYYWTPLYTTSWLELTILSPPETSSCFACTASMSEPTLSPRVVPPFWSCYAFPNGWNHQQPH